MRRHPSFTAAGKRILNHPQVAQGSFVMSKQPRVTEIRSIQAEKPIGDLTLCCLAAPLSSTAFRKAREGHPSQDNAPQKVAADIPVVTQRKPTEADSLEAQQNFPGRCVEVHGPAHQTELYVEPGKCGKSYKCTSLQRLKNDVRRGSISETDRAPPAQSKKFSKIICVPRREAVGGTDREGPRLHRFSTC